MEQQAELLKNYPAATASIKASDAEGPDADAQRAAAHDARGLDAPVHRSMCGTDVT